MYDLVQFRALIVKPALEAINAYSPEAEELLIATCANESNGGTYFAQVNTNGDVGPAYGCFQMEANTHASLWAVYIQVRPQLASYILKATNYRMPLTPIMLAQNAFYAAMMARVFYMQFPEGLPACDDIEAIWTYYKKYWNTENGAATHDQFISNYYKFIGKKPPKAKSA